MNKQISVVLGSFNRKKYLKISIDSIRNEIRNLDGEIIVVDGGSSDGTLDWLSKQKDIITIIQHNHGQWRGSDVERKSWGYFMNLGFKISHGKYILMVSDDCLIVPGAVKNGIKIFDKDNKIGAIAFYWRNWPIQKEYWVGTTLGGKMFVNHGLFLKKALEEAGFLDEETYSFYHGDGDICLKIWEKGYKVIDSNKSFVEHFFHANHKLRKSNSNKQQKDWENYLKKWSGKYYLKGRDTGDWIKISYIDKGKTANKFFKALNLNDYLNIFISKWAYPLYQRLFKH